jgi:hypothetical protein
MKCGELLGLGRIAETADMENPSLNSEEESERFIFESSAMKPMLSTLLEN